MGLGLVGDYEHSVMVRPWAVDRDGRYATNSAKSMKASLRAVVVPEESGYVQKTMLSVFTESKDPDGPRVGQTALHNRRILETEESEATVQFSEWAINNLLPHQASKQTIYIRSLYGGNKMCSSAASVAWVNFNAMPGGLGQGGSKRFAGMPHMGFVERAVLDEFDLHGTDWTKYSSKVHADTAKEKVATYGRDNCQPMAPLSDAKKRQCTRIDLKAMTRGYLYVSNLSCGIANRNRRAYSPENPGSSSDDVRVALPAT